MSETINIAEQLYNKLGQPSIAQFFEVGDAERNAIAFQYSAQIVETLLQDEPLYQAYLNQTKEAIAQDCAHFDRLVEPKRAKQVRRFYKLLKQIDPQTYRDTVDFRTSLGCLHQSIFDQFIADESNHLEQTLAHGFSFKPDQIYLKICEALAYQNILMMNLTAGTLIVDEKAVTWLRRFGCCYLRLLKKSDPQLWRIKLSFGDFDLKTICENQFLEFLHFVLK